MRASHRAREGHGFHTAHGLLNQEIQLICEIETRLETDAHLGETREKSSMLRSWPSPGPRVDCGENLPRTSKSVKVQHGHLMRGIERAAYWLEVSQKKCIRSKDGPE